MRAAVVVFPGSNCDRDLMVALRGAGIEATPAWHRDDALPPGTDLVGVPGGFAFGDYLRTGAIAARAPIMGSVRAHAARGGMVLGVCNGFQVLCEAGLLPGALVRNAGIRFVCRRVGLVVATARSPFTAGYEAGQEIALPVAHHDGNYRADPATLDALEAGDRVALRYSGEVNGSANRIAGVLSENRRVLGMMPHPERAADPALGPPDGRALFAGLARALAAA
jgi:phosphoribosylformylglycinamidine synthase